MGWERKPSTLKGLLLQNTSPLIYAGGTMLMPCASAFAGRLEGKCTGPGGPPINIRPDHSTRPTGHDESEAGCHGTNHPGGIPRHGTRGLERTLGACFNICDQNISILSNNEGCGDWLPVDLRCTWIRKFRVLLRSRSPLLPFTFTTTSPP